MPNQEGIETILALRKEFPAVKIIAMSGSSQVAQQGLRAAKFLGAIHTLTKPFQLPQLAEAVTSVLGG